MAAEAAVISLNRDATETTAKTLTRAVKTVEKALQKRSHTSGKGKRKGGAPAPGAASMTITIRLIQFGGAITADDVPSGAAMVDGARLELLVGDTIRGQWSVRRDRPTITALSLPEVALVGFPTICEVATVHTDRCSFVWAVAGLGGSVSNEIECSPTARCAGRVLSVTVTPYRGDCAGAAVTVECPHPVLRVAPEVLRPLDDRAAQFDRGEQRAANATLRVLSYNVQWGLGTLKGKGHANASERGAAATAGDEGNAAPLLAPHRGAVRCVADLPVPIETRHYRQHLLLREMLGWDADVACLQELTPPMHDSFLCPLLAIRGYGCVRSGELGVAWRRAAFDLECEASWVVSTLLDDPCNADVRAALDAATAHSQAYFRRLPHVGQAVKLKRVGHGADLIVVNVHLVMEKYAESFRALQLALILRRVQRWAGAAPAGTNGHGPPHVVVCGDFNTRGPDEQFTTHIEAALELLRHGVVKADNPSFVLGRDVGRPKPAGHRHTMPGDGQTTHLGAGAAPQCVVKLGGDAWSPQCPNAATEATGTLCWDHACRCCSRFRDDFRQATCYACDRSGTPVPPLPDTVAAGMFCCQFDLSGVDTAVASFVDSPFSSRVDYETAAATGALGGGVDGATASAFRFDSARRALPQSHCGFAPGPEHKYSFFTVDFHPPSGTPRSDAWVELRDHIFFSSQSLRPVHCAAPPPIDDFKAQLPGLTWPSDHLAIVADFCEGAYASVD